MSKEEDAGKKLILPERLFKPGDEPCGVLERVQKHSSEYTLVTKIEQALGPADFMKIQDSFLGQLIQFAKRKDIKFSRNLVNQILLGRILSSNEELWFTFAEQPMRFSLREFVITTGLPVDNPSSETSSSAKKQKREDQWMKNGMNFKKLSTFLYENAQNMESDEKVRLGALVLVEGMLIARNPANKIPLANLQRAASFDEFCRYPWGRIVYKDLVDFVKSLTQEQLSKEQYGLQGFVMALQMWALSSIDELGKKFAGRASPGCENLPLILQWTSTQAPQEKEVKDIAESDKVVVKNIVGDEKLYNNLGSVTEDEKMSEVIKMVNKGYRLTKKDWINGWIAFEKESKVSAGYDRKQPERAVKIDKETRQEEMGAPSAKIDKAYKLCLVMKRKLSKIEALLGINDMEVEEEEVTTRNENVL